MRDLKVPSQPPVSELFVLVAGWPWSGKSTLAAALAAEMRLPLLVKDEIKEALMDGLGRPQTVTESQRLGRAAVLAMLRVAQHCPGLVLDSTWFDYAIPIARTLPGRLVEVHCIVTAEVARSRYRARTGQRHAGHLDQARTEQELWGTPPRPLGLGPVLNIDTYGQADIARLARTLWIPPECRQARTAPQMVATRRPQPWPRGQGCWFRVASEN